MVVGDAVGSQHPADIGIVAGIPQLVDPHGSDAESVGGQEDVLQGACVVVDAKAGVPQIGCDDDGLRLIHGVVFPAKGFADGGGEVNPPGNKLLAQISRKLKEYIEEHYPHIRVYPKPYHVEKGGIYLKDAAVEAGLGCIGRNNLLITPEFGAKVRLRAIALSEELPSFGPLEFDPCRDCAKPCTAACPREAFSEVIYTEAETGLRCLPGREGDYYRKRCAMEMEENEKTAPLELVFEYSDEPMPVIRYCRACEFYCGYQGSREPGNPRE